MNHEETAKLILQRVEEQPDWYGDTPASEVLARAQVHATLALVDALQATTKPADFVYTFRGNSANQH